LTESNKAEIVTNRMILDPSFGWQPTNSRNQMTTRLTILAIRGKAFKAT